MAASSDRLRSVFGFSRSTGRSNNSVLHKRLDLAIQHVVAADQPQVLHDGLREVADHAAVVGNARRVEDGGMRDLAGGDVLEDDLPLFFLAELQVGHALMPQRAHIQVAQVLVFPVDAGRQHRNFNIQRVNVFLDVLLVNLNDQRRLGLRAFAHRLALQHHAFGLNGFHEIHEGIRADDADVFLDVAGIHLAQAAPQGLFGQDVALGGIGAQAHNRGDVAHVPAFFEHHDGDDGLVGAVHARQSRWPACAASPVLLWLLPDVASEISPLFLV